MEQAVETVRAQDEADATMPERFAPVPETCIPLWDQMSLWDHVWQGWGAPAWERQPDLAREASGRASVKPTTIAVTDLHYETQPDGGQRACLDVSVTSSQTPCSFAVTLPLDHQSGDVEATLQQAQAQLLTLFDDVVDELTSRPLERR